MLPKLDLPNYKMKLPSTGQEITFRPFTVKERKILLVALESKDERDMTDAVVQIAKNCIVGDVDVTKFAPFDVEYFFLQLKARSIGENTNLQYICRAPVEGGTCNNQIKLVYNVLNTEVVRNPEHSKKIPLSGGLGLMMKYPTIGAKSMVDNEQSKSEAAKAFDMIAECVDYVYDANKIYHSKDSSHEEIVAFLESIPDNDFKKVEAFFDTMPRVQDKLDVNCPKCGHHHVVTLEGLASFFD